MREELIFFFVLHFLISPFLAPPRLGQTGCSVMGEQAGRSRAASTKDDGDTAEHSTHHHRRLWRQTRIEL